MECLGNPFNIEDPQILQSRSTGVFTRFFTTATTTTSPTLAGTPGHVTARERRCRTTSPHCIHRVHGRHNGARREQPHVILSNVTGEPVALLTALFAWPMNGQSPDPDPRSDYVWTFDHRSLLYSVPSFHKYINSEEIVWGRMRLAWGGATPTRAARSLLARKPPS